MEILGNYLPENFEYNGPNALLENLQSRCSGYLPDYWTVRFPREVQFYESISGDPQHGYTRQVLKWHRDGVRSATEEVPPAVAFIYVWSNRESTEVLTEDGHILRGKPGDIIKIDNRREMHRAPMSAYTDRWFARAAAKQ